MPDTRAATSLDRLNEKEREVLRLFGRGHDAKSTACRLGLSVHTINERLRTARRKLDVTSSREAARLLCETEGQSGHQKLPSKEIGDAREVASPDPEGGAANPRSLRLWIGGFCVMMTFALAAALVASSQGASKRQAGDAATAIETAQLREFERVALDWLALVDAAAANGDWEPSFDAAGQSFQNLNTEAGWREASELAREPLGSVIKRDAATAEFVNAPPHGYVIMVFETDFDGRAGAVERVTIEREKAGWKAVGYVID